MTEQHDPMELASAWLRKRNLSFDQKTLYQLKIGWHVSYYPNRAPSLSTAKSLPATKGG
jgi:hypothetical protein